MNAVTILGAGNVAWHLATAFHTHQIPIRGIWSRDQSHAMDLATIVDSTPLPDPSELADDGTLVILAVPDHALPDLVNRLRSRPWRQNLFAHTSGATSIRVLEGPFEHYGVFYPLQTLTKGDQVGPWSIPFLVQGDSEETTERLERFANRLSETVARVNDDDRTVLHLSAVIINNFINHLGGLALEQLEKGSLDKSLLEPLAQETVRKMFLYKPEAIQTGPAKRGDVPSVTKHLQLLADNPRLAALYRQLSLSINPGLGI